MCQAERDESDLLPSPITPSDHSHFRTIHRQTSFDMDATDCMATVTLVRPEPQIGTTSPVPSDYPHDVLSSSINTQMNVKVTETHVVAFQSEDDCLTTLENKETRTLTVKTVSSTDNETKTYDITSFANSIHDTNVVNNPGSLDADMESQETCDEKNVSKIQTVSHVTFSETESKVLEAETEMNSADTITVLPKRQSSAEKLTLRMEDSEEGSGLEILQTNQNADSARVTPALESIIQSEDQTVLESSSKATDSQDKRKGSGLHYLY